MTDSEWAARIREIYHQRGLIHAIHYAELHGFMLSWVLKSVFHLDRFISFFL